MKNVFLFEDIVNSILLTEGAESRNMKYAKHYLYDNFGYDETKAMSIIGNIKSAVPNVRLAKCKFIMGVTRMFMTQELNDGEKLSRINQILRLVASDAHVNEYDSNLNDMKADELINRFATTMRNNLEQGKNDLKNMQLVDNNNYQIVKVADFDTASKYADYTSWCVTQSEDMYNYYTHHGVGLFYFCLKNGFENIPEEKGANCPLDEYGLSMIAVSVNSDGSCNTITCRWNHDNGGNDNIMTEKELSQLIGKNFYDVFKPYTPEEIEEKKEQIDNYFIEEAMSYFSNQEYYGFESTDCIEPIFRKYERDDYDEDEDDYWEEDEEYNQQLVAVIISSYFDNEIEEMYESEKYVIFDRNGDLVGQGVYDEKPSYKEATDTFIVTKDGQTNEISVDGTSLYPITVDDVGSINDYLRLVRKDGYGTALLKYGQHGRFEFAFNEWFQSILSLNQENFEVWTLEGKSKILNLDGRVIAENFTSTRKVSDCHFVYYGNGDDKYFKLFHDNIYTGTKINTELVSNINFKSGQGFYYSNTYACKGIDGKKYLINYITKQTYLADDDWKPVQLVDTVVDNENKTVTESFYDAYRKLLS